MWFTNPRYTSHFCILIGSSPKNLNLANQQLILYSIPYYAYSIPYYACQRRPSTQALFSLPSLYLSHIAPFLYLFNSWPENSSLSSLKPKNGLHSPRPPSFPPRALPRHHNVLRPAACLSPRHTFLRSRGSSRRPSGRGRLRHAVHALPSATQSALNPRHAVHARVEERRAGRRANGGRSR